MIALFVERRTVAGTALFNTGIQPPILSAATMYDVTTTTARPRVTITFS